jgi:cell division protein ZapA
MGQITVTVNGRRFDITCDDGQERHVETLAGEIDRRVGELAASLGALGDARLLLLAALLITDDLEQARAELAVLRDGTDEGELPPAAMPALLDASIGGAVTQLASRIEAVAARLREA